MPNTTSYAINSKLFLVRAQVAKTKAATPKIVETPTNHIAIIDCSGSMYGELPRIRQQLKTRLPKLLKEKDTFSVIWFSGRGQFGTLLEGEPVATLTDLAAVNKAIDRWLQPQGMTGFKEPLEEVTKLVERVSSKSGGNPFSLFFMSDGCDNQSNRADILKAVEKASKVVSSATFVEYGYYADRPLLTAMAEKSGGTLIHAQDFDAYVPTFEAAVQKRSMGGKKLSLPIEGDAVRGFAWALVDNDLVTYAIENGAITVPDSTQEVWYLSPTSVGDKGADCLSSFKDAVDPAASNAGLVALPAAYAALSLFSVRMERAVVLSLLKVLGDVAFIDRYSGLFGKQKFSEFMDAAKAATFDKSARFKSGYNPKKIPADDAFTVLDLLRLLATDDENRILLEHRLFKYNRIGRSRVDATSVLTDEEAAEVASLTAELGTLSKAGQDVKKLLEINTKIAAITSKLTQALKFEADPVENGYAVSGLTYNEEKPNISMLIRKTGYVDISKAGAPAGLPERFPTFIFRNYALVKDGLVNVDTLPVKLGAKTLQALFDAAKKGLLPADAIVEEENCTILKLSMLPIINTKMVKEVSAKELFENEWKLLKVQAAQKVFNTMLKDLVGTKKSPGFEETYGVDAAAWLKERGFSESTGFGPKQVQAPPTDVYTAKELSVAIKGFSSIPSLNEFKKQAVKGKYTPSAALMLEAVESAATFEKNNDSKALQAWLEAERDTLDAERRRLLTAKAQTVFSVIVGQMWFKEFSSWDENSLTLSIDGQKLECRVEAKEVEVKI